MRWNRPLSILLGAAIVLFCALAPASPAQAQDGSLTPEELALIDRPIVRVDVQGLSRVSETKVRNTIRTEAGSSYDPRTIQLDVESLYRLGDFKTVRTLATLQGDGSVVVTFVLAEQPLLRDVQVVGNNLVSDQELLGVIPLGSGVPRDEYLIEESQRRIKALYRDRGHFLIEVIVDVQELEKTNILLFTIIEGPRVKIKSIEFQGNASFTDKQLRSNIDTEKAVFLFARGQLDIRVIDLDVAAIDSFYKDRGYLDVRVDRDIQLSPDNREAKVIFVVQEGRVYTMRNVTAVGATVIGPAQIAARLDIKTGDVYSQDRIRRSRNILEEEYHGLGYPDVTITAIELRTGEKPEVDLRLEINEGEWARIGHIGIQGNTLTQDRVIRRELRGLSSGRPLNQVEVSLAEQRLRALRLFNDVKITPQDPDPMDPAYRDLLVEIKERDTGSFNFGVAVGSDAGVFGEFSINQRNFDIFDWPQSLDEYVKGRAFRGAGQRFNLRLAPGSEVSEYSVSLTDPHIFDTDYSVTGRVSFRDRRFREYDEERLTGVIGVSRRLGEFWSLGVNTRFEQVELTAIAPFAPTAVFAAVGPDTITAIGARLTRNTTNTFIRPGRGTVLELAVDQVGALGGDFNFTSVSGEYTVFLTLAEDFLGRRSILKLNTRGAYIFNGDSAPVYEKSYLGGRSFRGFEFRTVSPKGTRADTGAPSTEPVGGSWLYFAGAQYEVPIFEELLNGVVFIDSGTVTDDFGFEDYRVSVGFGVRLYIQAFGPVPIAFDFGIPLRKAAGDESQIFTFSADIPF